MKWNFITSVFLITNTETMKHKTLKQRKPSFSSGMDERFHIIEIDILDKMIDVDKMNKMMYKYEILKSLQEPKLVLVYKLSLIEKLNIFTETNHSVNFMAGGLMNDFEFDFDQPTST
jgi:hypothetical protein